MGTSKVDLIRQHLLNLVKGKCPRAFLKAAMWTGNKLEIPNKAQMLSEYRSLLEMAKARLREIPNVRFEKIAEVRNKMEKGFYDRKDVQEKIAERIILSGKLRDLNGELPSKGGESSGH